MKVEDVHDKKISVEEPEWKLPKTGEAREKKNWNITEVPENLKTP
jgi:hypothetical protein